MYKKIISVLLAVLLLAGTAATAFAGTDSNGQYDDTVKAKLENLLLTAWASNASSVDVSSLKMSYDSSNKDKNKLSDTLYELMCKHPEYFWVSTYYDTSVSNNTLKAIKLFYFNISNAERENCKAEVNRLVAEAMTFSTDLEKVLFVHDYLDGTVAFDWDTGDDLTTGSRTAWHALCKHKAVCQGISQAFRYIMKELGIECYTVQSKDAFHVWNAVKVNGKWYHIDITKDLDRKENFLVSTTKKDAKFKEEGSKVGAPKDWKYDGLKGRINPSDTTIEDSFISGVKNQMVYYNGSWYFVKKDKNIYRADFDNLTCSSVFDCNSTVKYLAAFDGKLYFSTTKKIYALKYNEKTGNLDKIDDVIEPLGNKDGTALARGVDSIIALRVEEYITATAAAPAKRLVCYLGDSSYKVKKNGYDQNQRSLRSFSDNNRYVVSSSNSCNHQFGNPRTIAPTCGTNGYNNYRVCALCGNVEYTIVPATGRHSFGSWQTTSAATCSSAGVEIRYCTCGASETRTVSASGQHSGGTATCKKKAVCKVCGQAYGELGSHVDKNNDGWCDTCAFELSADHPTVSSPNTSGTSSQESGGFFQAIINFFRNLFGRK